MATKSSIAVINIFLIVIFKITAFCTFTNYPACAFHEQTQSSTQFFPWSPPVHTEDVQTNEDYGLEQS